MDLTCCYRIHTHYYSPSVNLHNNYQALYCIPYNYAYKILYCITLSLLDNEYVF